MDKEELDFEKYSYLRPIEEIIEEIIPKTSMKDVIDENLNYNRIFFSNVDYDELEIMNIKSFKNFLTQNSVVLPEWFFSYYKK